MTALQDTQLMVQAHAELAKPLTVMVTGGGTGGHVYPGLSVVESLRRLRPDAQFVWVGTRDRLEAQLVPKAGVQIEFIRVSFLKGRGLGGKLMSLLRIPKALWQSWRLLRKHRPNIVLGVGGFASGPVTLMAALTFRKTAILEQNVCPGMTNRILGRVVRRVFLSFGDAKSAGFSAKKTRVLGNPIRADLLEPVSDEEKSAREAGEIHVLVFGGSQGARSLNLDLPKVFGQVAESVPGLRVRHASGKERRAEVEAAYEGGPTQVEITEYIDDMRSAYAWADLVVCRAGAGTVSEVTALGKPAVYVPFPGAGNHQEPNARSAVDAGAGLLVLDDELKTSPPVEALTELLMDTARLEAMGAAAAELGKPTAADDIAREILSLVGVSPADA